MPKRIQIGAVTQALQRAFGFKGRYTPMLDEVVVPVYVIADPAPAAETRICSGTVFAPGPSTTGKTTVQILNPPGSGIIVNVTSVVALSTVKASVIVVYSQNPLADPISDFFFRDRRIKGDPAARLSRDNDGAIFGSNITAVIQLDGNLAQTGTWEAATQDPRQPLCVLPPGQALNLQVSGGTVNDDIRGNFKWLEIPITEQSPVGGIPA